MTFQEAIEVLLAGGELMIPLFILAFFIYFFALELLFFFWRSDFNNVKEDTYGHWIERTEEAKGEVGRVIQYTLDDVSSIEEIVNRYEEVKSSILPSVDRRIIFLSILVTVAPLMGLLGTVTGMLATFAGIGGASGQLIDVVASGISEALITTQTGLVIAIPGYILVYSLTRRRQELAAFLAHLESLTLQHFTEKTLA